MKIGLISDTHVPSMGAEPPSQVRQAFRGVDLILHAGDVYTIDCIRWLEQIAPVESATSRFAGVGEGVPRVSTPLVVEAGGQRIGIVHKLEMIPLGDEVWPGSLDRYPAHASITDEVRDTFGEDVDIVVFGYTHLPMVESHAGILFVNPGSPNTVDQVRKLGYVAILTINDDGPSAEIIPLTDIEA
ncbi:MAG: metallophosphoesterase family protein [Dehalococcoidia bacterium]